MYGGQRSIAFKLTTAGKLSKRNPTHFQFHWIIISCRYLSNTKYNAGLFWQDSGLGCSKLGWGKPGLVLAPAQTILGIRHAFLPHERLLNWKINSFPIVRKYRLEITCRLSEIQSALLKSKCWQAKHIRTSFVECDTWPKLFASDENIGDKRWLFVYFFL